MSVVLRVLSFNVLHRVHALNWKEPIIGGFPDESRRIRAITAFVLRWLEGSSPGTIAAACLQEASGDQLASLRAAASGTAVRVFDHLYPRRPRLRGETSDSGLVDPSEHLVTLIAGADAGAEKGEAGTFDDDPGKGFLAVSVGDASMVNTHVSFGDKRLRQLARVAAAARSAKRGAAISGDFNAPADVVAAALGRGFALSDLTRQPPTRVPASGHAGKTIDHVAALRGEISDAAVNADVDLSDHRPVTATVTFP